ncbi:MAG: MBL fold metallo-hydrolase [Desulfobacteraceae bacterium]|jgi:glyoxylase-like metal-dependent hydrolase (beta-lactamase superfamily II)
MRILENLHAFCWPDEKGVNNCNTYFIEGPPHVLVDPGHLQFFSHVEQHLEEFGFGLADIDMVICTHVHPDHFESAVRFREHKALLALHEQDWNLAKSLQNMIEAQQQELSQWVPDLFLQSGSIDLGRHTWQVIHTPGHSPGSICLYWEKEKVLISGDVVFNPGIGRTDLPGGDSGQIRVSFDLLRKLPVRHLLPGHGKLLFGEKEARLNFERIESLYL